jgi:mevalonate kinase
MRRFYSKIILFGEYSVLTGSNALIILFRKYSGKLIFGDEKPNLRLNNELRKLNKYLYSNTKPGELMLDLQKLEKDIDKGMYFNSTIPEKYGLGSSGALVAALFHRYGKDEIGNLEIVELREQLAKAESYFHGKSSGTDPLSIFLDSPLLIKPGQIEVLSPEPLLENLHNFYLYDTRVASSSGEYVRIFLNNHALAGNQEEYRKYELEVNRTIDFLLNNDIESLKHHLRNISGYQLDHFEAMVPVRLKGIWSKGLDTQEYFFKFCGSGGGGFMLLYGNRPKQELEQLLQTRLIPVVPTVPISNR